MADPVHDFEIVIEQIDAYEMRVRFDKESHAPITLDEPAPLGKDVAPNAARILAAAIANCLSASLVFCMSRRKRTIEGLRTTAHVQIVRNEQRRLRIGKIRIDIDPRLAPDDPDLIACLATFEDFCTVTQSVRGGLDVEVHVAGAS
jgi:organic hydroperoxide reductase OsmC/OhrA